MSTQETVKLLEGLLEVQRECITAAAGLTGEQLDAPIAWRDRELPLRNVVYMMAAHPREHAVHIQKLTVWPRAERG